MIIKPLGGKNVKIKPQTEGYTIFAAQWMAVDPW